MDSLNKQPLIREKYGFGGIDWIGLAQDKDQWRALVKTILKIWVR
jgi:hypothetical protein